MGPKQNRRGFIQLTRAAVVPHLGGLPSVARAASEATGNKDRESSPGNSDLVKANGACVTLRVPCARAGGGIDGCRYVDGARCRVRRRALDHESGCCRLHFACVAADALCASGRHTLIVDCNAIAPDTVHEIAGLVEQAAGVSRRRHHRAAAARHGESQFVRCRGPVISLAGPQLVVHVIGEGIADASALKVCRTRALNKGTQALWLEVLIAAYRRPTRTAVTGVRLSVIVGRSANFQAYRRRPIAGCRTLRDQDLGTVPDDPKFFQGAADIYRSHCCRTRSCDKTRLGKDVVRSSAQRRGIAADR